MTFPNKAFILVIMKSFLELDSGAYGVGALHGRGGAIRVVESESVTGFLGEGYLHCGTGADASEGGGAVVVVEDVGLVDITHASLEYLKQAVFETSRDVVLKESVRGEVACHGEALIPL